MPKTGKFMSDRPETDALSDILRRMRLKAEIYARPDYCGTWAVDTSGHRKVAFHLIERGSAWLHTENGKQPQHMVKGDLVLFPHDAPHALASSESRPALSEINGGPPPVLSGPVTSLLCGFFEFQSKAAWPLLDGLPEMVMLDLRNASVHEGAQTLLRLIVSELERGDPGADAVVNELAYVLFIHVLRSQMDKGLTSGLLCALADPKIGTALNYLHADLAAPWTVDSLANSVAMSRSAFAKRFRELIGLTPMRYLAEWRMHEAKALLQQNEISMNELAYQTGYASEAAFRKAFKSIVGETPGQVRRNR